MTPNVIRCTKCGDVILIDLLNEGFDGKEIATKQTAHDKKKHQ